MMLGPRQESDEPILVDRGNFAFFTYLIFDGDNKNEDYMLKYARGDSNT